MSINKGKVFLAGCMAYDRTKDQFVQPVVKDVKKGMSRARTVNRK